MRTHKKLGQVKFVLPLVVVGMFAVEGAAQTPAPTPQPRKTVTATATVTRVVVQNKPTAPQVVTILHTLNGLKVLNLLIRKEDVEAIARLDQAFHLGGEVHTNVIAGLALDDGKTIAAWLPEAEAELPPRMIGFAPRPPLAVRVPATPSVKGQTPPEPPDAPAPQVSVEFYGNSPDAADLRVITRDGKRILANYVGLDGLTGLSLITLKNGKVAEIVDSKDESIVLGQQLRVIGPQPAPATEPGSGGGGARMYIRIGETDAMVVNVTRSPSGGIARVKIKSAKLSPANIGGIAINDKGETLGIVDAVQGEIATIVPLALVRIAATRVLPRHATVPRPWLGIKGEPVGAVSLTRLCGSAGNWNARALAEKSREFC